MIHNGKCSTIFNKFLHVEYSKILYKYNINVLLRIFHLQKGINRSKKKYSIDNKKKKSASSQVHMSNIQNNLAYYLSMISIKKYFNRFFHIFLFYKCLK